MKVGALQKEDTQIGEAREVCWTLCQMYKQPTELRAIPHRKQEEDEKKKKRQSTERGFKSTLSLSKDQKQGFFFFFK